MVLILGGTIGDRAAMWVADGAAATYYYSTKGTLQSIECVYGICLTGAMNAEEMECFCRDHVIELLIGAARPFAQVLHQMIRKVSKCSQIPAIRYKRRYPSRDEDLIWCDSYTDAIHQMENKGIQQLLALNGVNTLAPLHPYWRSHTTWFRILEREESLLLVEKQGLPQERLVFHQEGEGELKLLEQLHPDAILTKGSGFPGCFTDKVSTARQSGIPVFTAKHSTLLETFYRVYSEDRLRKQVERLLPEFSPLKSGYTTGACTATAARATLLVLLPRKERTESQITLSSGEQITLSVAYTEWAEYSSTTRTVIKEFGDSPDVTNYSRIRVTVQLSPDAFGCATVMAQEEYCQETGSDDTGRVIFQASEGIGTVTLPGLDLKVGGLAINATPHKMIRQELIPLLSSPDPVTIVAASVPGSEELAKRTFNPRLGVIGGVSIIGTSEIIRSFSSGAFIASIRKEASVAKAIGCETLAVNSGAKSERCLRSLYVSLPPQSFVHYGNFIGEALEIVADLGFRQVILGIMIGKVMKPMKGFLDTHSKRVIANKGFLQDIAKKVKCEEATVDATNRITLAREL